MNELHIHIEELVLHGFDSRQRHTIADAVQAELQRLFSEQRDRTPGATPVSRDVGRLDAKPIELTGGGHAAGTGATLAQSLHAAIDGALRARGSGDSDG